MPTLTQNQKKDHVMTERRWAPISPGEDSGADPSPTALRGTNPAGTLISNI